MTPGSADPRPPPGSKYTVSSDRSHRAHLDLRELGLQLQKVPDSLEWDMNGA